MGLTSDRLELASGSGSQRAKMSKNVDFLGLWAALGGQSGRLMAHDAVRALVGLPMGSTSERMAEFGRIWPWNQGLGLGLRFHPLRTRLIFARTGFINGAGYFDRLLQPSG